MAGASDLRDAVLRAGEFPAAKDDPVRSDERLQVLIDAGIRTFSDLTEADTTDAHLEPYGPRLAAAAAMRRLDLNRINLRIPDRGVIADEGYDDIVAAIDAARSRGGVFVTAGVASVAPARWSAASSPPPATTTPRSGPV